MDLLAEAIQGEGVVCLDYDDTIRGADGEPLADVSRAVATLRAWGYRVVVSSARFSPIYGALNRFRMEKVQRWMNAHELVVDDIAYVVPAAEVYVDDRAHRFEGSWSALVDELGGPHGDRRKASRVSLALDCLLGPEGALPGAEDGLARLRRDGTELVVSAGPSVRGPDVEGSLARVRRDLQATGLGLLRVEAAKISSDVYVGSRAWRFRSSWVETLRELEELLVATDRRQA